MTKPLSSYIPRLGPVLYTVARYYAAYVLLGYGFAKVMGAQFTVLDSQLARPMGDVSGFWLTWYYFGYSAVYSSIVAWAQIVGAALLCFRRTALIGALLLLPVMVNIIGIDVWVVQFPFDSGALRNAFLVFFALLVAISFHAKNIYRFLMQKRDDLILFGKGRRWTLALQVAVVLGMIVYTAHEGYWLANVNNRDPTPIDGAWHVISKQPVEAHLPEWIYFEYNRAYMVAFQFPNGETETHDFRIDDRAKALQISKEWLRPGSEIFQGSWDRSGDTLTIHGIWNQSAPILLTLQRKQMHIKDHR